MEVVLEGIESLFQQWKGDASDRIEKLPQSGSDRIYFRIYSGNETFIATYNNNLQENRTFINFTLHFRQKNLPVPEILAISDDTSIYIQQDLGTESLLDKLTQHGHNDYVYGLFRKSLQQLARIQILGDKGLNYDWCLTAKEFGKQAILINMRCLK